MVRVRLTDGGPSRYKSASTPLMVPGDVADVAEGTAPYLVDELGYFEYVDGLESFTENCQVVKSDGEVCGREKPCRYHD